MTSNSKAAHLVCVLSEMSEVSCYTFNIIPYRPIKVFSPHLWEAEIAGSLELRHSQSLGHSLQLAPGAPSGARRPSVLHRGSGGAPGAFPKGWVQSHVLGTRQKWPLDRAATGTLPGAQPVPGSEWQRSQRGRGHWSAHTGGGSAASEGQRLRGIRQKETGGTKLCSP